MRCLYVFLLIGWASACAQAQIPKPEPPREVAASHPQSVEFDGHTLHFAFEDKQPTVILREYIPADETLERWTRLAAFFEYPLHDDPAVLVEAMVQLHLQEDPAGKRMQVRHKKKTGEIIYDFITFADDFSFVEFNIFRFSKLPNGRVIAQQFAMRAYDKETTPFLKGLKEVRERLLGLMAEHGLRTVEPSKDNEPHAPPKTSERE